MQCNAMQYHRDPEKPYSIMIVYEYVHLIKIERNMLSALSVS